MEKNLKSELFRRIRIELAVILVAAIVLSVACFANFGVSAETKDLDLNLKGGPDYTFTGVDDTVPQFTVETAEALTASTDITKVKFDIKMPDIAVLRENMKNGSKGGSATSEKMVYTSKGFAIYFSGTDVTKVGITQADFYAALDKYADNLAAGQSVTMFFDLSGTFKETAVITGLNIMVSYGSKAVAFDGKAFSLSNIVFNPTDSEEDHIPTPPPPSGDSNAAFNELVLADGPDYKFTAQGWDPQLNVAAASKCYVQTDFTKIKFDLKMPDIETLRPLMNWGSRGGNAGSDTFGYGGGDFAIYFSGADVKRVGVTQGDFFKALDDNKAALAAGEAVTLEFTLSGNFKAGASISGISMMLAHDVGKDLSPFNDSPISISNMHFPVDYIPANLKDAANLKLDGDEQDAQLTVETLAPVAITTEYNYITFDLKLADYANIKEFLSAGSKYHIGGEGFSDDATTALGIYFDGTNTVGAGVTQADLFAALEAKADKLSTGETVSLNLPIKGGFADGAEITGINFMVSYGANAANLKDTPVSIKNIKFKSIAEGDAPVEGQVTLKGGPEYTLSGVEWYPQLNIETMDYALAKDTAFMQIELDISDIDKIITHSSWGSRGGGVNFEGFGENNSGYHPGAFGIYFEGENVARIGVTQENLINMLGKKKHLFGTGEKIFLELPVSVGEAGIPDNAVIKKICWMTTHGGSAANYSGIKFNIDMVSFSAESRAPAAVVPVFGAEDIWSTNESMTVVNFEKHKVYVILNSTVGDLLDTVLVNEEKFFSRVVNYQGQRMANKSKLIADYDYTVAVSHPEGFSVEFEVIPCKKKGGVIDITSPAEKPKAPSEDVEIELEDEELDEDLEYEDEFEDEYDEEYDEDIEYEDEDEEDDEETVVIPSNGSGKGKVIKKTVTENNAMYTIPQLIILIAASVLVGAAIMFIVDLFIIKGKKKN